jgi:hypothetical protein
LSLSLLLLLFPFCLSLFFLLPFLAFLLDLQ